MRWASAHSTDADPMAAAREVGETLERDLGPGACDLVLLFAGAAHVAQSGAIAGVIRERLSPRQIAGVSANGVVTSGHEVESGPAISAIAARLPGVTVSPFIVTKDVWAAIPDSPEAFDAIAPGVRGAELVLLFADPFSLDSNAVLAVFHRHAPGCRAVGGIAGASPRPGGNALVLNDWVSAEGGFAIALGGAIRADVVVSQGCRPVGPPLEVTRVQGNVVFELDGQPALERAEQVLRELPEAEREHLKHGLYVGRPVRRDGSGRAEYLIRNLLGADRERGLLAIGDQPAEQERIRLHVRDGKSARDDLEMLLAPQVFDSKAHAALLFLCNGRGRGLHGRADGDLALVTAALGGATPAAGMFCAGEIGPLGERNYVHGHTASIAILRPAERAPG